METTADFLKYAEWVGIGTLVFATLTLLAFVFKWGIRFRLVGISGFSAVLTVGLFALGVVPFMRTVVPGAVHFSTVYDGGGAQAVIAVPPTITETELRATLEQAANNLYSLGRLGQGQATQLTIRARAILHPEPGVSQPLVLGQVRRSLSSRDDAEMEVEVYSDRLAQLPSLAADVTQP